MFSLQINDSRQKYLCNAIKAQGMPGRIFDVNHRILPVSVCVAQQWRTKTVHNINRAHH
jgi:hypothetical protein